MLAAQFTITNGLICPKTMFKSPAATSVEIIFHAIVRVRNHKNIHITCVRANANGSTIDHFQLHFDICSSLVSKQQCLQKVSARKSINISRILKAPSQSMLHRRCQQELQTPQCKILLRSTLLTMKNALDWLLEIARTDLMITARELRSCKTISTKSF